MAQVRKRPEYPHARGAGRRPDGGHGGGERVQGTLLPGKGVRLRYYYFILFCCEFDLKKTHTVRHDLWKDNRFVLRNPTSTNIYLYALYARVQNKNDR